MIRLSLVAVVSADGFIGRRSGEPPPAWTSPEEQAAFRATMTGFRWSFLGRLTHEGAPNPERRRVIFTRTVDRPTWAGPNQILFNPARSSFDEIVAVGKIDGPCAVLGGTAVYDYFLELGRIDDAEISIEPLNFGTGQAFFSGAPWRSALERLGLRLVREERLNTGGTLRRFYARSDSPER